jgi:hypothetical protein
MNLNIESMSHFYAQDTDESPVKQSSTTLKHYEDDYGDAVIRRNEDAVTSRKFIVGSLTNAGISFAAMPVIHVSEASARTECDRLARVNPGKTYIYCQLLGGATLPIGLKRL